MAPKPVTLPGHTNPPGPVSLGCRVAVYWPRDSTFYAGKISRLFDDGRVQVSYDDGDLEKLFLHRQAWEYVSDVANYPRHPNLPPSTPRLPTPAPPAPLPQPSAPPAPPPSRHRRKKARAPTPKSSARKRSISPNEPSAKHSILPHTKRPKVAPASSPPAETVSASKHQPSSTMLQATSLPSHSKTALATKQAVASLGHTPDPPKKHTSCLTSSTLTVPTSSQKQPTLLPKPAPNKDQGKLTRQKKKASPQPKNITKQPPNKAAAAAAPPVLRDGQAQPTNKVQTRRAPTSHRKVKPFQPAPSNSSLVPQLSSRPLPQLARPIVSGVPLSRRGNTSSTAMASASQNADVDKLTEGAVLEDGLKNWAGQVKDDTIKKAVRPLISSYSQQLNDQSTRVAKIGEQVSKLSENIRDIDQRCHTLRADVDFIESEALSTPAVKRMLDSRHGHQKAQIRKALESYFDEMKTYIAELVKSHVLLLEKRITEQVVKKSDQLFESLFADVCRDVKGE